MGFGSYDESEQREPDLNTDDDEDEAVQVHSDDYEGDMSFEPGASTNDLVDRLAGMKEDTDDE